MEVRWTIETEMAGKVGYHEGVYFLAGRENLVALRQGRYRISLVRFRKVRKILYFLRFFPYLRAVAISGSQALLNSDEKSDIDLLVITKKNRIWLARALISFYLQILGQRRHGPYIENRFCLNHYICEGQEIRQDQNLYTAIEYASLLPILGEAELHAFWLKNIWLGKFLKGPTMQAKSSFMDNRFSPLQRFLEIVLDFTIAPILNALFGTFQKHRIKLSEHVLVSDEELSFHPGSRGQKVLSQFQKRLFN